MAETMTQRGRGKTSRLTPLTRFFLLMLYLTSRFTARSITHALNLRKGTVARVIAMCLRPVASVLESLFPHNVDKIVCREGFPDDRHVLAVGDASPIFIIRLHRHKGHYYSGKYMSHCVKVQELVTRDGQCIHLSRVC
jgi:hypothetical protein